MAWVGRDGRKRYNCTKRGTIADKATHELARRLIDGCLHLTPASEAEIDAALAQQAQDNVGEIGEPDPVYLEAIAERANETPWTEDEPSAEDLLAIDNEGI